jgi:Glycosyl transferases group 1
MKKKNSSVFTGDCQNKLDKIIHIICPEPPLPLIHGGRFDLFYKMVALHHAGIGIHLHCFGRQEEQLNECARYCLSVQFYPRKKGIGALAIPLPYIVSSRSSKRLLATLMNDNHPILFEGIHATEVLRHHLPGDRKLILRLHNAEYIYYEKLHDHSTQFFKKVYYGMESILLKRYEKKLAPEFSLIAAVSATDEELYKKNFGVSATTSVPVFVKFPDVTVAPGDYCLYHGNLSVAENESAVRFLVNDVFADPDIPLIVAGRNPGRALQQFLGRSPKIKLIANPSSEKLNLLIAGASVNIIPSMNATGVKLKLIHALFAGGHCITNAAGVAGSGLDQYCTVADTAGGLTNAVRQCYENPLSPEKLLHRKKALEKIFNAGENADRLIRLIW